MEYSDEEKRDFARRHAESKTRQVIASILFVPLVFGGLVLNDPKEHDLFGIPPALWVPVVVVALVAMIVFSLANWRCPACDKYLGKGFNPRFCPRCGAPLKA